VLADFWRDVEAALGSRVEGPLERAFEWLTAWSD